MLEGNFHKKNLELEGGAPLRGQGCPLELKILQSTTDAANVMKELGLPHARQFLADLSNLLAKCFQNGGKVLIAGNGGSLCDAMHFAEELTGQFRGKRSALPAIALSDPGHLTCCANDMGFEKVFSRGIEAFGKKEDLFIGLTTSGNSANLIQAFDQAKKQGLVTVAFLGKGGGELKGKADLDWTVSSHFLTSDRIQEAHMAALHIVVECVEALLFDTQVN